jgi:outer membrane protein assembly factor BamB
MGPPPCDHCGAPVTDRFGPSCGRRAAERERAARRPIRATGVTWAVLAAAVLLSGCDPSGPDDDEPDDGAEPLLVWRTHAGGWSMPPAVDADHVYYLHYEWPSLEDAQLMAVSAEDGAFVWASPIISGENTLVVGDAVGVIWGNLRVFDRTSGAELWRFPEGSGLANNLATDEERFYVGSHGTATVYALVVASGAPVWDSRVSAEEGWIVNGVSVADGHVAIAAFNPFQVPVGGLLAVLDAGTGEVLWTLRTDPLWDPPLLFEDLVIVKSWGHLVLAVDRASGQYRWSADQSHQGDRVVSDGLALCGDRVVAAGGDMSVSARAARTGELHWKSEDLWMGSISRVTCPYGTVLAQAPAHVRALDPATGVILLSLPNGLVTDTLWAATRDASRIYLSGSHGLYVLTVPEHWP